MRSEGYPIADDSLERVAPSVDGRGDLIDDDTASARGFGEKRHLFELRIRIFKRCVEIPCLLGDARPAEALDRPFATGPSEALAFLGVFHQ